MTAAALVTGGGSGIGAACAVELARRGWPVLVADIDLDAAERVAAEIDGAVACRLDVAEPDDCERATAIAIERWGAVEALVTAAGIVRGAPADALSIDDFRAVIDVNLNGTYFAARAVGRAMIAAGTGGRIVLVGSILSAVALPERAAYASTKGAVVMLGKVLALDWAAHEINVNVIGPGITATAMSDIQLADPDRRAELLATIPAGRLARPDEIAAVVGFLCSPEASYLTGAFIPVDGGFLAGGGKAKPSTSIPTPSGEPS